MNTSTIQPLANIKQKSLNDSTNFHALSPMLFGIHVDELLSSHSGSVCKIGQLYYGAVRYADDVVLLKYTKE